MIPLLLPLKKHPIRMLFRLKIVVIVFITCFLVLEACLRIFFFEQLKTRVKGDHAVADSTFGYLQKPFTTGPFITPSLAKIITINSQGFDSRDFNPLKKKGDYRIAILGSSGENSAYVSNKPYPDILHFLFQNAGHKVEVINCSVGGAGRDYTRVLASEKLKQKYQVDFIILIANIPLAHKSSQRKEYEGYVIDFEPENKKSEQFCKDIVDEIHRNPLITRVYDYSFVVRAICKKYIDSQVTSELKDNYFNLLLNTYITKRCSAKDQIGYVISGTESINILKELKASLDEQGVGLYLINYFKNAKKASLITNLNLPLLDLELEYKQNYSWPHDGHLNDIGHEAIAKSLFNKLLHDHYIPKKYLNK